MTPPAAGTHRGAAPIGIYVHIPYCLRKCPYCDFNSQATRIIPEAQYAAALEHEILHYRTIPALAGRSCRSVFFGGGTPSLLSPAALDRLITALFAAFPPLSECEVTLEANPAALGERGRRERMAQFKAAGVNRVSLGAQSFSDRKLQALGRIHDAAAVQEAIEDIQSCGTVNYSLDLIFGAPGETLEEWCADLAQAGRVRPPHLSVYGLTVEPGTVFGEQAQAGRLALPQEEVQELMLEQSVGCLRRLGYARYEISNYALPGFECRHNGNYWRRCDYLGLGAGAHSFLAAGQDQAAEYGVRWWNISNPRRYMEVAASAGSAEDGREVLSSSQAELEFFLLGLRTAAGVDLTAFPALLHKELSVSVKRTLEALSVEGLLLREPGRARFSDQGFMLADSALLRIAAAVQQ